MLLFILMRRFKETKFIKNLLTYSFINKFYNIMDKYMTTLQRYNEKEHMLFSQSFIGYWVTQSRLSIVCRMLSLGLLFIFSNLTYICVEVNYYPQFFLIVYPIIVGFAILVYGVYLSVALILSIKHAKALCSNSPITVVSCLQFLGRTCIRVAGVLAVGSGVLPIDWTCEKAGVKPIFAWAYYPGMQRLAGHITPELASQPSKDLVYANKKIPGSSFIHYLQNKTDQAEEIMAEEYKKSIE